MADFVTAMEAASMLVRVKDLCTSQHTTKWLAMKLRRALCGRRSSPTWCLVP
jgi:hypothetical protein